MFCLSPIGGDISSIALYSLSPPKETFDITTKCWLQLACPQTPVWCWIGFLENHTELKWFSVESLIAKHLTKQSQWVQFNLRWPQSCWLWRMSTWGRNSSSECGGIWQRPVFWRGFEVCGRFSGSGIFRNVCWQKLGAALDLPCLNTDEGLTSPDPSRLLNVNHLWKKAQSSRQKSGY